MRKPIIGIAGGLFYESKPILVGAPYDFNNNTYSQCIFKAGGIPIYLPVINDSETIDSQLGLCDGLLVPGGDDVNPIFYKESPKPLLESSVEIVDSFQIKLINKALELNKPIFAICRGMQVLNISTGGSLYQDISYANSNYIQHKQNSHLTQTSHSIKLIPQSILSNTLGNRCFVNSAHHQCVKKISTEFMISALAPDGVIEGIEMKNKKFVVGVQWHPEMLSLSNSNMLDLFKCFIFSSQTNWN
ncbi:gamma-glutamyl-gamma-aminobutyrate hydrolase family protein [Clostridium sp.]|uniref:gamma-glutamyl-gamma-aminobutyrate hydrolase family protein n=1 Tax=Clostridium sp. TaxID=1506 RepID=UPI003F3B95D0